MIPIELTIQGLYSYQERQTIDFTRLTAANLFGIFGPVGSGKSSILEAITFAIYGRTDRLNLSGDNRYYNMMNLRSNELLIDFIFEAGKERVSYRATARCTRNSRNFDDVRTPERTAYEKRGDEWIPISLEALEQSVGLSYDNFKRTIIIPQGQFQEFLQLGNRDRTRMMKELFNLEKYEFYYKVVSLEKKNDAQRQLIQGQLQQLGAIDPEQLKEYEDRLSLLDKNINEQNKRLRAGQQKEEELRKLQELVQKKEEAEKELKRLLEQEPLFQALQKKITRYEQAVIGFKHLLESLQTTEKKKEIREVAIRDDREKVKTETAEIERLKGLIETMKPAFEKRDALKKKAEELGSLLDMKATEQRIAHEESRLVKGTEIWEKTIQELENLRKEKQLQEEAIRSLRREIPDLARLSSIQAWHVENRNRIQQLQELGEEVQKLSRQQALLEAERAKLASDPLLEGLSSEPGYTVWYQRLDNEKEAIKEEQRLQEEHESHLHVKAQLKAYAEELEENKPCPLCGSIHHPDRFTGEEIDEELKKLAAQKQSLEQRLNRITVLEKELALLESRQKDLELQQGERERKRKEQQEKVADHEKQFIWTEYQDEEALKQAFNAAREGEKRVRSAEISLQEDVVLLEKKERDKERFQEELQKIKTSLAVLQAELKTKEQQLTLVLPDTYRQSKAEEIEQEKNRLLQEHEQLEKAHQEHTAKLQDHLKRKDRLEGILETNINELEQENKAIGTLHKQLDEQLQKSPFQSIEEVALLLSERFDTEVEKGKVARFNQQLLRVQTSLEQLTTEVGGRRYDADAHREAADAIAKLKEEIDAMNREQGKVAELLKTLRKDIETRARLQEAFEKLDTRAENIRTMKSLFKASGFVNYVSSVYLQNLCNAANDRFFQLTRQQLSLEITGDNNFQVRDFLNGGKVRSVKTLSGGQTFQASLSLALALADNIQQITQSHQNFFFLDEGFGSLDKESLNIVFDTLKSLRKENRVVGVISHVEEMQQEIDAHLRVENDPEQGTLIHRSWEI